MGTFGSGLFFAHVQQLFFGDSTKPTMVYAHGDGKNRHFVLHSSHRTWANLGKNPARNGERHGLVDVSESIDRIEPLKNEKDTGRIAGTHRFILVNKNGRAIMQDGRLYDIKKKRFVFNDSDRTPHSVAKVKTTFPMRLVHFLNTPTKWLSLMVALLVSFFFDTGIFEMGKYIERRSMQRKQDPVGAARGSHVKEISVLANNLSPVPLTLKPLKAALSDDPQNYLSNGGSQRAYAALQQQMANGQYPSPQTNLTA